MAEIFWLMFALPKQQALHQGLHQHFCSYFLFGGMGGGLGDFDDKHSCFY
jgi:hypothetical protein